MQRLTPFVWFDGTALEAAEHYAKCIPGARVVRVMRHLDDTVGARGDVLLVFLEIDGEEVMLLNGGPSYSHPGNVSLYLRCKDQAELDQVWDGLTDGGEALACGWLKDRFGVLWQVHPEELDAMLAEGGEATLRVLHKVWGMTKIEVEPLRAAFRG